MVTEAEVRNVALTLWLEQGRTPGAEKACWAQAERLLLLREEVMEASLAREVLPMAV